MRNFYYQRGATHGQHNTTDRRHRPNPVARWWRMVWAGTLVLVHSIASDDEAVPSFSIATVHSSSWNPCVNGEFPDQCLKRMPRPPRHPSESDLHCGRRRCRIFPPHSSGRGWYARSRPGIAIGPPKAPMPARHVLRRSAKAPVTWNARSQARGKAASRDDLRKLAKLIPMPSPHPA